MAVLDRYFRYMVEHRCSDLHISVSNPPLVRKDGDIIPIEGEGVITLEKALAMLREVIPERSFLEFEATSDTDFAYELIGVGRFRANIFLDRKGWGGVFRLIPDKMLSAKELGLTDSILKFCSLPKGMVLVTGPTGSGKSTTLAAMIDHINRNRAVHIVTIEDPIEFTHENQKALINQREIGWHTKTFARALRAALREDPDVVLIGEMRDLETSRIAIETAETGHLVFATLHTSTAATTVDRMINQFPAEEQDQIRLMLSNSLRGVISQTLLKRKGGGRVAAQEILFVSTAIAANIREGKTHQVESNMQISRKQGCILLNDALQMLVKEGKVEPEEAYFKSVHKDDMLKKLAEVGKPIARLREDGVPIAAPPSLARAGV